MQNVWGEENVPENALLPEIFGPLQKSFWPALSWSFCISVKNRALTPEGGGKRTVRGGVSKPLFGRRVIREVFHTPLFSTPPWRPLTKARRFVSQVPDYCPESSRTPLSLDWFVGARSSLFCAPRCGVILATDLAISVRLASVSVLLASFSVRFASVQRPS